MTTGTGKNLGCYLSGISTRCQEDLESASRLTTDTGSFSTTAARSIIWWLVNDAETLLSASRELCLSFMERKSARGVPRREWLRYCHRLQNEIQIVSTFLNLRLMDSISGSICGRLPRETGSARNA